MTGFSKRDLKHRNMAGVFTQRTYSMHRQMLVRLRRPLLLSSTILLEAPLLNHGSTSTSTTCTPRFFATERVRRRKRPYYGKAKIEGTGPPKVLPEITGMKQPYAFGGEDGKTTDDYLKKTSLSPWVPIPDPIARKLFDMSAPTPEDVSLMYCIVGGMRC